MRCDKQVREFPQRIIPGRRFLFKHIQSGIQPAVFQFPDQCRLVNDGASAHIDNHRAVRQQAQLLFPDHMESLPGTGQ